MNRPQDHVFQFFLTEMGTEGSIAGDSQLVLRGRYTAKNIESLLRRYILEYVTCHMCKAAHTDLKKDQSTRLWMISCHSCGASRSVQVIKSGFHAATRADRKRAKNAN
eukprot:Platyproteum_vivax@DN5168_c0_g1_i2.p1